MSTIVDRINARGEVTSVQVKWRRNGERFARKFKDRAQAELFATILEECGGDAAKAERAILKRASDSPTIEAVAKQHLARLTDVTPHTLHTYERMIVNHVSPKLGTIPIDMLTDTDLAEWVAWMRERGKSAKTISNVHGFLYSVIKYAVRRHLRNDNPCEETRLPKNDHTQDTTTFLTRGEVAGLLKCIPNHFKPFVLFQVGTGLRFSETAALTAEDFTDDGKGGYTVRVTKAWKRDDKHGRYIGPPKTQRARRTVPLAPDLAKYVAPLVSKAAKDGSLVFTMKQGGDLTPQAFHNKVWKSAVEDARSHGLRKHPRVHDLRHTYASWQLSEGVTIYNLSRIMGHESITTTTKVYAHLMPEALTEGAAASARAMSGLVPSMGALTS
jgi:integrase